MQTVTPEDLIKQARKVESAAEGYKDHIHQKKMLELWGKHFLAAEKLRIKEELIDKGESVSEAKLDTMAVGSDQYKKYLTEQLKRLKISGRAEVEYKTAHTVLSAMQSALSAEKQQWTSAKVS